jgi:hypothetical protein
LSRIRLRRVRTLTRAEMQAEIDSGHSGNYLTSSQVSGVQVLTARKQSRHSARLWAAKYTRSAIGD